MTDARKKSIKGSNNSENPNQNICARAVAYALDVDKEVRYLHTLNDLIKAARKKWTVRSRFSLWNKHFKNIPLTVNQFIKMVPTFTMKSNSQTSFTEKEFYDPDEKRNWIESKTSSLRTRAYIIYVKGHVMLISSDGTVHTDTAPKENADRRQIKAIYAVGHLDSHTTTEWADEVQQ